MKCENITCKGAELVQNNVGKEIRSTFAQLWSTCMTCTSVSQFQLTGKNSLLWTDDHVLSQVTPAPYLVYRLNHQK